MSFPELQGIAGRHYALHDGETESVADAIEQHYWPKFSGDALPLTPEAAALALADRLDTLVGIFGIGQSPTGSKDPFALRRASLAAIRILLRFAPGANIDDLLQKASASFNEGVLAPSVVETVKGLFTGSVTCALRTNKVCQVDVLRSVTAVGTDSFGDIDSRSLAVTAFAGTEAAEALAAAK